MVCGAARRFNHGRDSNPGLDWLGCQAPATSIAADSVLHQREVGSRTPMKVLSGGSKIFALRIRRPEPSLEVCSASSCLGRAPKAKEVLRDALPALHLVDAEARNCLKHC